MSFVLLRFTWRKGFAQAVSAPLNPVQSAALVRCINSVKRQVDYVGEYIGNDVAVLLPDTNTLGAKVFIQKLALKLQEQELPGPTPSETLSCSVGLASVPRDCREVLALLNAAEFALAENHRKRSPRLPAPLSQLTHNI
jgi:GGDEF domain-containing protein